LAAAAAPALLLLAHTPALLHSTSGLALARTHSTTAGARFLIVSAHWRVGLLFVFVCVCVDGGGFLPTQTAFPPSRRARHAPTARR
jgi:hypothetical protein